METNFQSRLVFLETVLCMLYAYFKFLEDRTIIVKHFYMGLSSTVDV